jgi:tungstate transport system ATP-binding protein
MPLIELKNVSQRRDGRDILKNISLAVDRGEVLALIGPTGAGKSTLIRILDLLDSPASGKVFFNGADMSASETARLEARRRMGYVLQKPVVFNSSVFDNIAHGLKWRGAGKQQTHEKVKNVIETVGLSGYERRRAKTLSGGEMQRVAIARAIVSGPEVLLLDEPTANLDPVSASKIEDLIEKIIKGGSIAVIMATHDMPQGQRLAHRISVMMNGEIVQTGNSHEIFNSPMNRSVAEFVGMENIIDGVIASCEGEMAVIDVHGRSIEAVTSFSSGEEVSVCMRPEDITVALSRVSSSARNSLTGMISWMAFTGPLCRVGIDCGFQLIALVTRRSAEEMKLKTGTQVYATFKSVAIHVIKRH